MQTDASTPRPFRTALRAYYELSKPGIIYSNLLTAAAGFFLAARYHAHFGEFLALLLGLAGVIGGACVFNNIIDRDIDARMQRTKDRAMVSGAITVDHALWFGSIIEAVGIFLLVRYTNLLAGSVALLAAILYVGVYTPMKRRSAYAALVGSIPGALPPVVGYVAIVGHLDLCAVLLFVILALWQMAHFYAISIYRMHDYHEANVPVYSIEKGVRRTKHQIIGYVLLFLAAIVGLHLYDFVGVIYFILMTAISLVWLGYAVRGLRKKTDDVRWARSVFLCSLVVITAFSFLISLNPR